MILLSFIFLNAANIALAVISANIPSHSASFICHSRISCSLTVAALPFVILIMFDDCLFLGGSSIAIPFAIVGTQSSGFHFIFLFSNTIGLIFSVCIAWCFGMEISSRFSL